MEISLSAQVDKSHGKWKRPYPHQRSGLAVGAAGIEDDLADFERQL